MFIHTFQPGRSKQIDSPRRFFKVKASWRARFWLKMDETRSSYFLHFCLGFDSEAKQHASLDCCPGHMEGRQWSCTVLWKLASQKSEKWHCCLLLRECRALFCMFFCVAWQLRVLRLCETWVFQRENVRHSEKRILHFNSSRKWTRRLLLVNIDIWDFRDPTLAQGWRLVRCGSLLTCAGLLWPKIGPPGGCRQSKKSRHTPAGLNLHTCFFLFPLLTSIQQRPSNLQECHDWWPRESSRQWWRCESYNDCFL